MNNRLTAVKAAQIHALLERDALFAELEGSDIPKPKKGRKRPNAQAKKARAKSREKEIEREIYLNSKNKNTQAQMRQSGYHAPLRPATAGGIKALLEAKRAGEIDVEATIRP